MGDESIRHIPLDWPLRSLSRSVVIEDINWHVQVGGTGPTLLLLHGTGASAHSFSDVVSRLLERFTVVVPDLPGHGFTTGAAMSSLTLPAISKALDRLLERLALEDVALVAGHSAGAALALRWSLDRKQRPSHIVGFNPALIAPAKAYNEVLAPLLVPLATSPLVSGMVALLGGATGMVDHLLTSTGSAVPKAQRARYALLFRRASHVRGALGLMAAADLPALLRRASEVDVAVRLVLGQNDHWIPRSRVERVILARLPRATVEIWPGGHLLHEEHPLRAAALLETLANADNATSCQPESEKG